MEETEWYESIVKKIIVNPGDSKPAIIIYHVISKLPDGFLFQTVCDGKVVDTKYF
jgi:hypothetical protein